MSNVFEQITADIRDHKWEFYGAVALPLYITIYPPMYATGFVERYGLPFDALISFSEKRCHWLMRADQLEALAEKMLPVLLVEQWNYYEQWMRELESFEECNDRFIATDLSTLDEAELRALMREYREVFETPFVTNNIIEPLSFYFLHHLKRLLLEEEIEEYQASVLMDIYGQAARPSYIKECAEEYRRAKNDEEKDAVLRKYYYINSDYAGVKPVSMEDLEKLAETSPYLVATLQKTEGISPKAQALLDVMQIIATIQDVRKEHFLKMVCAARGIGKVFARRSGIAYEDIEYATWAELESGILNESELKERHALCVLYWTLNDLGVYVQGEAEQITKEIDTHVLAVDTKVREVKGFCASKGKVTGRAVVVLHPGEFDRVQKGDILVTMMTRPEFLPVMHKAAAFVCDEGGITSHAAIVAREMKKPCVIGTKTGTRIFKDGDMLEVDADKGIVRILNV